MILDKFLDRGAEINRLRNALSRPNAQFLVVYGRRRIGKSKLIKQVLSERSNSIYFLADRTNEAQQRWLFSKAVSDVIQDFDKVTYPDWETLIRALSRQTNSRIAVCLDEFPYLVKSCPSLPSIIQKLLNERSMSYDLIICGSSQQLMQGYVLDRKEPLYGLADEIMRITQIPPRFIMQALECDAVEAVKEYSVWGGVPRYWELRKDYDNLEDAITSLMLDPNGFLCEEPQRLLRDDMRDSVQTETLLSIIGNGANKLSEIASRAGKTAPQLTETLSRLREMGYVERETPFGENEKKSKKGLYHITDPLFKFLFRYISPYRSILELGRIKTVKDIILSNISQYEGECWELLCRNFVSGNVIDGIAYNKSGRWWGKIFPKGDKDGEMIELDVVAESIDRKHILIGECKWTSKEDAQRLFAHLERISKHLPFVKRGQRIHLALFLKESPSSGGATSSHNMFLPNDVLAGDAWRLP